jgi:hypothetical protein
MWQSPAPIAFLCRVKSLRFLAPKGFLMKSLFAMLSIFVMAGCASTAPPVQSNAERYPDWLEMKTGYAEACIRGGGCVPMTQGELQQMARDIMLRTLQACRRTPGI